LLYSKPSAVGSPFTGESSMSSADPPENSEGPWPSCVNKTSEHCIQYIKSLVGEEANSMSFKVIGEYDFVTMDYRTDRVWIRTNTNGIVTVVPRRGWLVRHFLLTKQIPVVRWYFL